eukprot:1125235-Prorocentrum_minimum.AAC.1
MAIRSSPGGAARWVLRPETRNDRTGLAGGFSRRFVWVTVWDSHSADLTLSPHGWEERRVCTTASRPHKP